MLKSCGKCGKMHDINYTCYKNKTKIVKTEADKFRSTYKWQQKTNDIKERDKFLCRCCIANIYGTYQVFNHKKLEVHHIVPLHEDYDKRLDDDNLITLCCFHHKMADDNNIPREILKILTDEDCNLRQVRDMVFTDTIPPTFYFNKK